MKRLILLALMIVLGTTLAFSQNTKKTNAWRTGVSLGINYNMLGIGYQDLTGNSFRSTNTVSPFYEYNFYDQVAIDGASLGVPFISLYGEYLSTSWWGAQFRISYDNRSVMDVEDNAFDRNSLFDFNSQYLLFEPGLVIQQPVLPKLKIAVGPSIAMNLTNEIEYTEGSEPTETIEPDDANFGVGAFLNLSYDFMINERYGKRNWYLSPFLETSWLVNQRASILEAADQDAFDDVWTSGAVRFGVKTSLEFTEMEYVSNRKLNNLVVSLPADGIVYVRKFDELFPLWQYVFFDEGSQEIPDRYIKLNEDEAKDFREADLKEPEIFQQAEMQERIKQQMYIYYNMMNVYADRMRNDRNVTLNLVGSAPKAGDGDVLAQKVKDYLVNNFGIDEDRITTEGVDMPRIPSGSSATPAADRPLADAENRRVEFVFSDEEMSRPVRTTTIDEAPVENDIIFVINDDIDYKNWYVDIRGDRNNYTYGPFEDDIVRVNPVDMMRGLDEGTFKASIVVITNEGSELVDETEFYLTKLEAQEELANRFTIIFDYAQSDPVKAYEETIRGDIAGSIGEGNKVIIYGHTDVIGRNEVNKRISRERASDVSEIMKDQFSKDAKTINIEATGYGEQQTPSTFDNKLPEGRMYNRNVMIDVFPLFKAQ